MRNSFLFLNFLFFAFLLFGVLNKKIKQKNFLKLYFPVWRFHQLPDTTHTPLTHHLHTYIPTYIHMYMYHTYIHVPHICTCASTYCRYKHHNTILFISHNITHTFPSCTPRTLQTQHIMRTRNNAGPHHMLLIAFFLCITISLLRISNCVAPMRSIVSLSRLWLRCRRCYATSSEVSGNWRGGLGWGHVKHQCHSPQKSMFLRHLKQPHIVSVVGAPLTLGQVTLILTPILTPILTLILTLTLSGSRLRASTRGRHR